MMKNLIKNAFILLTVASMTYLVSCNDEDPEDPTPDAPVVSLTAEDEVSEGEDIELSVTITAAGGFDRFSLYVDDTFKQEFDASDFSDIEDGLETTFTQTIEVDTTATAGTTLDFSVEVVDKNDLTATATASVDIVSPAARSYTAVLLAAPLDTRDSETFFSTNSGEVYSMNEVNNTSDPISADIDFGYFYGSTDGATLSDPDSYPFAYGQAAWGTRNSTTFRRTSLTSSAFAEVTNFAAIEAAYEAATAADTDPGIESGLVQGEVLAFATDADKTGGSKKGLILINSIVAGDGEDGQINIEVIVQEDAD